MKCASPIECASDRACATADAEQQLRSASFSASDHSSSVTATVSPRAGAEERRDGAVDAAAHRHERAAGGRAAGRRHARAVAHRGAERAGQRVGGELRRVQLSRAEAAELGGDLRRPDPRGVQHGAPAREADRRAAGGGGGAAAGRVESHVGHAVALDAQREIDLIAAGEAAGPSGERAGGPSAMTLRRGQMVLEGDGVHRRRG